MQSVSSTPYWHEPFASGQGQKYGKPMAACPKAQVQEAIDKSVGQARSLIFRRGTCLSSETHSGHVQSPIKLSRQAPYVKFSPASSLLMSATQLINEACEVALYACHLDHMHASQMVLGSMRPSAAQVPLHIR